MPAKPGLTAVEKDKVTFDPNFDFRAIAQRPYSDIPGNEMAMWKWCGVYQQLQKGFFMIRLRVPGGLMTAEQVERAGDLADQYGQGQLCITTRQCLQFHWIRQQDLYKVRESMAAVGILTQNACGDVTRNVVTCPLEGVCPHEVGNTRQTLLNIADDPELLNLQRNLPRKHKISVAGCGRACGQTLMNCQGWVPVARQTATGGREVGWAFHAGGGLGARPVLAKLIFAWVPEDLVVEVARASTEAFRRHGERRLRHFSRLKFLVEQMGPKAYAALVISILRERGVPGVERLEIADGPPAILPSFLDGQPVIPQKQAGFSTVRVMIERSEFTGPEARRFAAWARQYGDGTILFTNRQNLQFRFVPDARVAALQAELRAAGYRLEGFERLPDTVACVGTTMCNLAVSDTPNTYRRILDELSADAAWWAQVGRLRINMNGCPNSCGQHSVADIGLRGTRTREKVGSEEGYAIYVGGSLANAGHVGEYVCDVAASDVVRLLRFLLDVYVAERRGPQETFGEYARRIGGRGYAEKLRQPGPDGQPVNFRNLVLDPLFADAVLENWFRGGHAAASGEGE